MHAEAPAEASTTRRVGRSGKVSFAAQLYAVGVWLAGETVEVSVEFGLVSISHRGVLVATHAQRHRPAKEPQALHRKGKQRRPRPRQPTVGQIVARKVDSSGAVSFAGAAYKAGNAHRGRQSRSPLSATPWRSQPAARCRGCIGSSTTAAESTARSPTPQEGPRAPTRRVTPPGP